jgi:hypothetical protein
MKKVVTMFLSIVLTITSFAQERSASGPMNNVIKANTLTLILASGSIFYERKLTDMTSAQMGVGYMNYRIENTKLTGLFLTPEFKIYVRKDAIDGFFISPYLRFNKLGFENKDNSSEGSLTTYGGGISFGRQWIFAKGLILELFFGGHYSDSDIKVNSGTEPPDLTELEGFRTRVGFCVGFAF